MLSIISKSAQFLTDNNDQSLLDIYRKPRNFYKKHRPQNSGLGGSGKNRRAFPCRHCGRPLSSGPDARPGREGQMRSFCETCNPPRSLPPAAPSSKIISPHSVV